MMDAIVSVTRIEAGDLSWFLHDIADRRESGHRLLVYDLEETNHIGIMDLDAAEHVTLRKILLKAGLEEDRADSWNESLRVHLEDEAERLGMTIEKLKTNLMGRGGREVLCGTWR